MSELPYALPYKSLFVGVDPGKNFGVAVASKNFLFAYSGKINETNAPLYGIDAIEIIDSLFVNLHHHDRKLARVEGASHSSAYGQDLLAQIRFGFAYALKQKEFNVHYVPPHSARKQAFGSAKISGKNLWLNLNPNAADAVGIVLSLIACELEMFRDI